MAVGVVLVLGHSKLTFRCRLSRCEDEDEDAEEAGEWEGEDWGVVVEVIRLW